MTTKGVPTIQQRVHPGDQGQLPRRLDSYDPSVPSPHVHVIPIWMLGNQCAFTIVTNLTVM